MKLPGWLPGVREHREIAAERERAERRAAEVEEHLITPLRAMRTYDYLTEAVQAEILRKAREAET